MSNTAYNRDFINDESTELPLSFLFYANVESRLIAIERTDSPLIYFEDAAERYAGIDLNYYRTSMTNYEFRAFIDFIGEDSFEIDFQPSDFEIYYPGDED